MSRSEVQAMEWTSNFFVWSIIILPAALLLLQRHRKHRPGRLPPGPPGWPVLGNLFDLGTMPHRTLAGLRNQYGDIVWLNLGAVSTMVILSAKAATEFFKNHDLSFAERSVTEIMRVHDYDKGSVALAPYGPYWRVLRRLVTVDMLVHKRIKETEPIRSKCVNAMLVWIEEEAQVARVVHLGRFVFIMTFNMLGNLMLSRDLSDPKSKGSEFFSAMNSLMEWGGHANVADFFPWLKWLDPMGLKRNMKRGLGRALKIASGFVKERVEGQQVGKDRETKDFLDLLLEYEGQGKDEPAKLSEREINIFILEIFMAGSETTSSTTEWAMTELLCNPEEMIKVKDELTRIVGSNRKVEESDIDDLPYLQAVVKETLRLHPPIPLLVPRRAMQDTSFMGYDIPKNTQVFVNAWAIGRDPDCWDEPLAFKPERFIGSKVDYRGQHYELIPFGAGRRMCAGVPLAHRMLNLVLGSLLHHFDWELDGNVTPETMDMRDTLGITMRKLEPLTAIPKIGRAHV